MIHCNNNSVFMPTQLFLICNGANTIQDVFDSINSTYGGRQQVVKDVRHLKTDKNGNTYTMIDVYCGGPLTQSRIDRLISQLCQDKQNRGERFYYQVKPRIIEWTIKLHIPRESDEPYPTSAPTFR